MGGGGGGGSVPQPTPDDTRPAIQVFKEELGLWPSNADIQWIGKGTNIDTGNPEYKSKLWRTANLGNTPAPKGHYVINPFYVDRSGVSGISGIAKKRDSGTPSCVSFYAGRVWYSGVDSSLSGEDSNSSRVFFSQILESISQAGHCYQSADPTSEEISELIASDGGAIRILGAGQILALEEVLDSLLVFAENGVWQISNETGSFTATSYSVSKVTSDGCVGRRTVVNIGNAVAYWADTGIVIITPNDEGIFSAKNVSEGTIQSYYLNSVPPMAKKRAVGAFDRGENVISWLYYEDPAYGDTTAKTHELSFRIAAGGFYKYEFATKEKHLIGFDMEGNGLDAAGTVYEDSSEVLGDYSSYPIDYIELPYISYQQAQDDVITGDGQLVTSGINDPVYINVDDKQSTKKTSRKYLVSSYEVTEYTASKTDASTSSHPNAAYYGPFPCPDVEYGNPNSSAGWKDVILTNFNLNNGVLSWQNTDTTVKTFGSNAFDTRAWYLPDVGIYGSIYPMGNNRSLGRTATDVGDGYHLWMFDLDTGLVQRLTCRDVDPSECPNNPGSYLEAGDMSGIGYMGTTSSSRNLYSIGADGGFIFDDYDVTIPDDYYEISPLGNYYGRSTGTWSDGRPCRLEQHADTGNWFIRFSPDERISIGTPLESAHITEGTFNVMKVGQISDGRLFYYNNDDDKIKVQEHDANTNTWSITWESVPIPVAFTQDYRVYEVLENNVYVVYANDHDSGEFHYIIYDHDGEVSERGWDTFNLSGGGNTDAFFGELNNTLYVDNTGHRKYGNTDLNSYFYAYPAYLKGGDNTLTDPSRDKEIPYLTTYLYLHDPLELTDSSGNDITVEGAGALFNVYWNFTSSAEAGLISTEFDAYKLNEPYVLSTPSSALYPGKEVVINKNRVNGNGKSASIQLDVPPLKGCHILGYSMEVNGAPNV